MVYSRRRRAVGVITVAGACALVVGFGSGAVDAGAGVTPHTVPQTSTTTSLPYIDYQVRVGDASAVEGDPGGTQTMRFRVDLWPAETAASDVPIVYQFRSGTAVVPYDIHGTGRFTVTIPRGATGTDIVVGVVGDLLDESDEQFTLDILNVGGLPGNDDAVGTIIDDDPNVVAVGDATVVEASGKRTATWLDVSLGKPVSGRTKVVVETVEQSAESPQDYNRVRKVVTFEAGQTTARVRLWVKGDKVDEQDETFGVRVAWAPAGWATDDGTVTVVDDD